MCLYLVTLLETMGITAIDSASSTMGRLPAIVSSSLLWKIKLPVYLVGTVELRRTEPRREKKMQPGFFFSCHSKVRVL